MIRNFWSAEQIGHQLSLWAKLTSATMSDTFSAMGPPTGGPPRDDSDEEGAAVRAATGDVPVFSFIDHIAAMSAAQLETDAGDSLTAKIQHLRQAVQQIVGTKPPPTREAATNLTYARRMTDLVQARARARMETRRPGGQQTAAREIRDVALPAIDTRRLDNVRLREDEPAFAALVTSMSAHGLQQPVGVAEDERVPGRFILIYGFRRVRAARELGWPAVPCVVFPAGTPEETLYTLNSAENFARKDLSDFEKATRAAFMREKFGTDPAEFARRTGIPQSTVEVLMWLLENLPPDIIEDWRNEHPLLSRRLLQRLAKMPGQEASDYWQEWRDRFSRCEARVTELRRGSNRRPSEAQLARAWIAVKKAVVPGLDDHTRDMMLRTLEFAQGHAMAIPGVYEPRPGLRQRRAIERGARELPLPGSSGEFVLGERTKQ